MENAAPVYPLDVLVIGSHEHTEASMETRLVISILPNYPRVRHYGSISPWQLDRASDLFTEGRVNTVMIDLTAAVPEEVSQFIRRIRTDHPRIVVVLFAPPARSWPYEAWIEEEFYGANPEFRDYFLLRVDQADIAGVAAEVFKALAICERVHYFQYSYDVTLSFAGEDRPLVRAVALRLREDGARVFFDEFLAADVLGRDLTFYLREIYAKRSRYCLVFVSAAYARKIWPRYELRSAQERAVREGYVEYVLPIRIDDVELPGFSTAVAFLDAARGAEAIAHVVAAKLCLPSAPTPEKVRLDTWSAW
jgi:hypothetical protein